MNNKVISVHVSEQDKLQIQARAKAANMSVSEYVLYSKRYNAYQ